MDEKSIQRISREECIEKLKEIAQHGPSTLEEMKMKLRSIKHKGNTSLNVAWTLLKFLA